MSYTSVTTEYVVKKMELMHLLHKEPIMEGKLFIRPYEAPHTHLGAKSSHSDNVIDCNKVYINMNQSY